eukprot:6198326-Pleurochrysis_carterae.AAC.1
MVGSDVSTRSGRRLRGVQRRLGAGCWRSGEGRRRLCEVVGGWARRANSARERGERLALPRRARIEAEAAAAAPQRL